MGKILSMLIMALLSWGVVFIILRVVGVIEWHSVWVVLPILIAVVIWAVMLVVAVAQGFEYE